MCINVQDQFSGQEDCSQMTMTKLTITTTTHDGQNMFVATTPPIENISSIRILEFCSKLEFSFGIQVPPSSGNHKSSVLDISECATASDTYWGLGKHL